ncbi:MAG: serine/threonine protein kinase [Proteobacteria bacterium]|nr:serine/threonine protein kinase [Pseudomonadota bacterium]
MSTLGLGSEGSASPTAVGRCDAPDDLDAAPVPRVFGDFALLDRLAGGGMGQVYRALRRDAAPGSPPVALKRILPELASDSEFVARFISEARIARTLDHPNIVRVLDYGELGSEHYLVMEFVDGADLAALLAAAAQRETPLPRPAALLIAVAMAQGLGAAHRRSVEGRPAPVVHRDVSPQNVLVARDGSVKVTDFGIAQAAEKAVRTRSGVVIGRCRYMSPEQARGAVVDARSDVFSAAVVLFEMLAGRPLFAGSSAEQILRQVAGAPIPQPREALPDCPPALLAILSQALERHPEQRQADGLVLAAALEEVLRAEAPGYGAEALGRLVQTLAPPATSSAVSLDDPGATLRSSPAHSIRTTAPAATKAAQDAGPQAPPVAPSEAPWALSRPDPQAPTLLLDAPSAPSGHFSTSLASFRRAVPRGGGWRKTALALSAALLGVGAGLWIGSQRPAQRGDLPSAAPSPTAGAQRFSAATGAWRVAVRRVLADAKTSAPRGPGTATTLFAVEVAITRDGAAVPGAERWLYLRRGSSGVRVRPLWTTAGATGPIVAFAAPPGREMLSLGLLDPGPQGGAFDLPRRR